MVVADISSGVAAIAALAAVFYARATVSEARNSRHEASAAHTEEMTREAELLEATQTAHEREMVERERALARELWLQRLAQLGRVQELLGETSDIARYEIANPPPKVSGQFGTWTRVTGALVRVEAAVVILDRLKGPPLSEIRQMAQELRRMNTPPQRVVSETMGALASTLHLAEEDVSFRVPDGEGGGEVLGSPRRGVGTP